MSSAPVEGEPRQALAPKNPPTDDARSPAAGSGAWRSCWVGNGLPFSGLAPVWGDASRIKRRAEEHHARERGDPEARWPVGVVGDRQSYPGFCERERRWRPIDP